MSFKSINRQPVEVQISNSTFGPFAVARKVCLVAQRYEVSYDNQTRLLLEVDVRCYELLASGETGPLIVTMPLRRESLQAANDTLVDDVTGEILAICPPYPDPAGLPKAWQATIEKLSQDRDTILQGDFFAQVAKDTPVRVNDLVLQYIQQADAMGRFT